MLGSHGQFRWLGVTLWSNALGVSSDDDYDNPVNVQTSTLKLKMKIDTNKKNKVGK